MAQHIMSLKAPSMADVLTNMTIALLATDMTSVEVTATIFFLKQNAAEVSEMVQAFFDRPPEDDLFDKPPEDRRLKDVPIPIWRAFCLGHERVSSAFVAFR